MTAPNDVADLDDRRFTDWERLARGLEAAAELCAMECLPSPTVDELLTGPYGHDEYRGAYGFMPTPETLQRIAVIASSLSSFTRIGTREGAHALLILARRFANECGVDPRGVR